MKELAKELEGICAFKEIKARQRSRDRNILKGDRSTSYFHVVANHRHRKKRIEGIVGPDGLVQDTKDILKVVVVFYKELFKAEDRGFSCLGVTFEVLMTLS
jgi:hypothetical protein